MSWKRMKVSKKWNDEKFIKQIGNETGGEETGVTWHKKRWHKKRWHKNSGETGRGEIRGSEAED